MLSTITTLFICFYFVHGDPYCYVKDENPYRYFGTTTSYELAHPPEMIIPETDKCEPVYVWAIIRSGTRYWSKLDSSYLTRLREQIVLNHEDLKRGSLCPEDLENFKSWENLSEGKSRNDVAPQGKIELFNLGQRLGKTFSQLIQDSAENISFKSTSGKTAIESSAAVIEGIFGSDSSKKIPIPTDDDTLYYIEKSKEFDKYITNSQTTFEQMSLFFKLNGDPIINDVSERLGFKEPLTEDAVQQMYFSCAFETALAPNTRPAFCAAFNEKELKLLEYGFTDLLGYYEWGYGSQFNIDLYNPALNDLITNLNRYTTQKQDAPNFLRKWSLRWRSRGVASKSENKKPKVDINLTHAPTLTHTLVKLGLYRDREPLMHNNYDSRKEWLMSKISPFSGNLIAVLQKCPGQKPDEYQVTLFHNEHPIQIPNCSGLSCPLSEFQEIVGLSNKHKH